MRVRVTYSHTEDRVTVDHHHDFMMRGDGRFSLRGQKGYDFIAAPKTAKRQLTNNGRVTETKVVLDDLG